MCCVLRTPRRHQRSRLLRQSQHKDNAVGRSTNARVSEAPPVTAVDLQISLSSRLVCAVCVCVSVHGLSLFLCVCVFVWWLCVYVSLWGWCCVSCVTVCALVHVSLSFFFSCVCGVCVRCLLCVCVSLSVYACLLCVCVVCLSLFSLCVCVGVVLCVVSLCVCVCVWCVSISICLCVRLRVSLCLCVCARLRVSLSVCVCVSLCVWGGWWCLSLCGVCLCVLARLTHTLTHSLTHSLVCLSGCRMDPPRGREIRYIVRGCATLWIITHAPRPSVTRGRANLPCESSVSRGSFGS